MTDAPLDRRFPATRFSVVQATGSDDPSIRREAWDALVRAYWRPVYAFIRLRWNRSEDDAADLTQEFFTRALEGSFFESFDPGVARFRTYLRVCLERFLANTHKAATRQKRGGGARHVSFDFAAAERDIGQAAVGSDALDEEAFFHREAIRSLFSLAIEDLRAELEGAGKATCFEVFTRYDLEDPGAGERPTYREIGEALGIPATQVTNFLHYARRAFRRIVLDRLREISGTETEFREEARALLGVEGE